MALDITSILSALGDHAAGSGYFERVTGHEPKSAPGNGLSAAIWPQRVTPVKARSGLASTSVRLEAVVRLYSGMLAEPTDEIDPGLIAATDYLMGAYSGDFALGGLVSMVDLLGAYGAPLDALAGYLRQDNTEYRVMTITAPLIINDLWNQEA